LLQALAIKLRIVVIMGGRLAAPSYLSANVLSNFDCVPKVLYENMSDHMQWLVWLAGQWVTLTFDLAFRSKP